MSRLAGVIVLIVLLAAGVWFWTGGDLSRLRPDSPVAVAPDAEPPAEPAIPAAERAADAAGDAADTAADAAAIAADAAAEAAGTATDAPAAPASEAALAAQAAAEEAIRAADAAADAAARADQEAVTGNVQDAADAAREAVSAAESAAAAARDTTGAAQTAAAMDLLLTPEGFDAVRVAALIDASDIAPAQKTTLKAVVASAASNPDMLRSALEQVRAVLE